MLKMQFKIAKNFVIYYSKLMQKSACEKQKKL